MSQGPTMRPLVGGLLVAGVTVVMLISISSGPWAFMIAAPLLAVSTVHLVLYWHHGANGQTDPEVSLFPEKRSRRRPAEHARRAGLFVSLAGALSVAFSFSGTEPKPPSPPSGSPQSEEQEARSIARGWQAEGGPKLENGQAAQSGDIVFVDAGQTVTLVNVTPSTIAFTIQQRVGTSSATVWCYEPTMSSMGESVKLARCGRLL